MRRTMRLSAIMQQSPIPNHCSRGWPCQESGGRFRKRQSPRGARVITHGEGVQVVRAVQRLDGLGVLLFGTADQGGRSDEGRTVHNKLTFEDGQLIENAAEPASPGRQRCPWG